MAKKRRGDKAIAGQRPQQATLTAPGPPIELATTVLVQESAPEPTLAEHKKRQGPEEAAGSDGAPHPGFPIVGIGASAGGLDAFKRFFNKMPADSGVGFVLVPHLDPTHDSLMVDLIARHTRMPVCEVKDGMQIEPNCVYVIPPNKYLSITHGKLQLSTLTERHGSPTAIDFFFRSLATEQRERAIGIILSGTSSHGTLGLKEIKLVGGMVMVQQPESAEFDQMPTSAIATGLIDFILPPEQMPDTLVKYIRHPYVQSPREQVAEAASRDQLNRILAVLRSRTKYDFRSYRKNMLMRRVLRRMGICQLEKMPAYLDYLHNNPDEVTALYKDLLIGVTDFFRDPEAFQVLQQRVIPELAGQDAGASSAPTDDSDRLLTRRRIRVWVPGCATGEEAYTIAMLLIEHFAGQKLPADIQVFATDIDERSLETARQGIYSESSIAEISPERLLRFFTRIDPDHWKVNKQLRDTVTIAPQNLISDAPFSRLDLISCRNLLIYLEPEVQAKVIRLFHFALVDGGCLLLGPSESIGREGHLFESISKKWRVFRRIGSTRRNPLEIPIVVSDERHRLPAALHESAPARLTGFKELMHQTILEEFAPAAALINRKHGIICVLGPLVNYLEFPPGEITWDLLAMARPGLRTKVRSAIYKAIHTGDTVIDRDARVKRDGAYVACTITVKPLDQPKDAESLLLVTFQDREYAETATSDGPDHLPLHEDEANFLKHLEHELTSTREDLQNTVEEYESSTEELKASNEEVMSMNEELQSSNEELESSKEELQSLNEELHTVNNQIQEKVEEVDRSNSDLMNLMASSDVATVFLDTELRIKRFTPPVAKVLNLRLTDLDRPIGDFAPKFDDDSLLDDCHAVLEKLVPIEKEVWTKGEESRSTARTLEVAGQKENAGRLSPADISAVSPAVHCYLRRILPYRSADNRIDGVVITLVDITQRVAAETRSRRLAAAFQDSSDAITLQGFDGRIFAWNRGAERLYGYSEAEALQMNIGATVPENRRVEALARAERLARGEAVTALETQRLAKDGRILDIEQTATTYRDERGQPIGVATTERDISERNRLQKLVLEIATEEQRRIGQELHDGTGQELTGLTLFAGTLVDLLNQTPRRTTEGEITWLLEEADLLRLRQTADKLAEGLAETHRHVQQLSHGILPVQIETEGLRSALEELAAAIDTQKNISCRFEYAAPVEVANNSTATHLYRIAQEATNNALRHSQATQICISLSQVNDQIILEVSDNGIGIDQDAVKRSGTPGSTHSFGLGIMNYRAGLIGGTLQVANRAAGGTLVTCVIPRGRGSLQ